MAKPALMVAVTSVMADMKSLLKPRAAPSKSAHAALVYRSLSPKQAAVAAMVFAGGLVGADPWHASNAPSGGFRPLIAAADARDVSFANPRVAFDQGLGAYRNGYYEIAIPAFEFVVARNDPNLRMFAEFYLARIFSDSTTVHTDHAKAYMLYQRIADEHADMDPDDMSRAPFVGKALTSVAIYVKNGLPEIALKPDVERAVEYLRHAATMFNEMDAQFELSKIQIGGEELERRTGLHFLQKLARESHPGAQAVFADLLYRGKYVKQDKAQAFAMIQMAVENAASSDRIWIEDIYQNIFCGSPNDVRVQSQGYVANWRRSFARPRALVEAPAVGPQRRADLATPSRACSNGEALEFNAGQPTPLASQQPAAPGMAQGLTHGISSSLVPAAGPGSPKN